MDGTRHELFARTRLARDQHRNIRRTNLMHLFDQLRHRRARIYKTRHQACASQLVTTLTGTTLLRSATQRTNVHSQPRVAAARVQFLSATSPGSVAPDKAWPSARSTISK